MQEEDLVSLPPPIESLLTIDGDRSWWPSSIWEHPVLESQAITRRILISKLDTLHSLAPDPTKEVRECTESGEVDPILVAEVYELLTAFLRIDEKHRRIILYLPLELLPDRNWDPKSERLTTAIDTFLQAYTKAWQELLSEADVRANFVDGDILESELSPSGQPRVVKVTHLIPMLLQKNILTFKDIINILSDTPSDALKDGIADTLPILIDMGLLSSEKLQELVDKGITLPPENQEQKLVPHNSRRPLTSAKNLHAEMDAELRKIRMRMALDLSRGIPNARVMWEKQEHENELIGHYGNEVALTLMKDSPSHNLASSLLKRPDNRIACLVAIDGIKKSATALVKNKDPQKARGLFSAHIQKILDIWIEDMPETRDSITSLLAHMRCLGIIDDLSLSRFNISLPILDSLTTDVEAMVGKEVREISPAIQLIRDDPEISGFVYPLVIFFGSRLKGYAKQNADLDVAVFIKPGTPQNARIKIHQKLAKILQYKQIDNKIVQFWLSAEANSLSIVDFPEPDASLADSTWAHLLLASVWLGQASVIEELFTKLLPNLLYSAGKKLAGHDLRDIWLEEMEREVLQYRLMHKGYRRFFPRVGGPNSPCASSIDSQSVFWDSGYRRMATKLFLGRVFLPQLQK